MCTCFDQLYIVYNPSNVHDALNDLNWTKAMNEKLALQKKSIRDIVSMLVEKKLQDDDGVHTKA